MFFAISRNTYLRTEGIGLNDVFGTFFRTLTILPLSYEPFYIHSMNATILIPLLYFQVRFYNPT